MAEKEEEESLIDIQLRAMENEVFAKTRETIDSWNLAIVRIRMMADNANVTKMLNSNDEIADLLERAIQPVHHHYENLSPMAANMLKWGWALWGTISVAIISAAVVYALHGNMLSDEQQYVMDRIKKADSSGYFLDSRSYKYYVDKAKGVEGVMILPPLKEEEPKSEE